MVWQAMMTRDSDRQTDKERERERWRGRQWYTYPASSATSCISASTWFCGVVNVDDAHIVSSITWDWTSRFSNCCSNRSISWLIWHAHEHTHAHAHVHMYVVFVSNFSSSNWVKSQHCSQYVRCYNTQFDLNLQNVTHIFPPVELWTGGEKKWVYTDRALSSCPVAVTKFQPVTNCCPLCLGISRIICLPNQQDHRQKA